MSQTFNQLAKVVPESIARFDARFAQTSPSRLAANTLICAYLLSTVYKVLTNGVSDTVEDIKLAAFYYMRKFFGRYLGIDAAIDDAKKGFLNEFADKQASATFLNLTLPEKAIPREQILAMCKELTEINVDVADGAVSGCIYANGENGYTDFLCEAMKMHQWTNPLHGGQFSGVRKMEAEMVSMVCNMFHGGTDACGTITTGGTESILLVMRAMREHGHVERGITKPEMVVGDTAHASFFKAGDFFKIKVRRCRMDPVSCKLDLNHMKQLVNRNTVVIVGSAPHYPHGIIDPIEQIAAFGLAKGIPVHVDCCMGGFLLPFMEKAGFPLDEKFDFRVAGVTSISCDTHKYGFAPKGNSTIMYKNQDLRQYQMHTCPDWPGGIYATPTMSGSRIGSVVAGGWAAILSHGEEGYVKSCRDILTAAAFCKKELQGLDGIRLLGDPKTSIVAFTSDDFDIYRLLTYLKAKKWEIAALQFPPAVHMCFTGIHTKNDLYHAKRFIVDCKEGIAEMMRDKHGKPDGVAALYGTTQTIPDRSIVGDVAKAYFDAYYEVDLAVCILLKRERDHENI